MKRVVLLIWLLTGLAACSNDMVTEVLPQSDSVASVGLDLVTSASRAMDTNAAAMRATDNVDIYYYSEFYQEGSTTDIIGSGANPIEFSYIGSEWEQSGDNIFYWKDLWGEGDSPSDNSDPRIFFYSLHRGQKLDENGENTVNESAPIAFTGVGASLAVSSEYTVNSELSDQEDLVYCMEEYNSLPVGGRITATFRHALSRIELYAITGDYNVYTTKVQLNSLCKMGTPTIYSDDFIAGRVSYMSLVNVTPDYDSDTTPLLANDNNDVFSQIYENSPYRISWGINSSVGNHEHYVNYSFYDNGGSSSELSLIDGGLISEGAQTTVATDAIVVPQTISASADDINSFFESITGDESWYAAGHEAFATETDYNAFFTATSVEGTTGVYPYYYNTALGKGYLDQPMVMVMYRSDDALASGYNVVGYSKVSECVEYQKMVLYGYDVYPSTFDPAGEDADQPLYLLAGFPFGSDLMLEPGYDYDLFIGFESTGGILLCDFYFLADGTMTNIPIDGIDPGDYVLGYSENKIDILVTNTNVWGYNGGVNLNENSY